MYHSKIVSSIFPVVILCLLVIVMASCYPKTVVISGDDTGYVNEHALSEQTFNDVQTIADHASIISGGSLGYRTSATTGSGCATVTKSNDTILIDFGKTNCLCHDGRMRRGQIIITCSGGGYATTGSSHTITFNNFYQNDNKVTGIKTVTNMGNNTNGQPYFNITVNGAVTLSGGGTISSVWTRTRTWVAGYDTPNVPGDDIYNVIGTGTLTRPNGNIVNVNIPSATPLVIDASCKWFEAGSVIYSSGALTHTLNYGTTPVCDNKASITLSNGSIRDILLP